MANSVVFRVDASITIGTGHVIRCLTLAKALRCLGWHVAFVVRDLEGAMDPSRGEWGFETKVLPARSDCHLYNNGVAHGSWAEVSWERDSDETRSALKELQPDLLVLDHYAFDARWENSTRPSGTRVMAIDDLADRPHNCDIVLDQNLGRLPADYDRLVPVHCQKLIGPKFALLRPEFARLRAASTARAGRRKLEHIVISMGGIDLPNATGAVLDALVDIDLPSDIRITVVMGHRAPALDDVRSKVKSSSWRCDVRVDVDNMAALLATADLVIGAAGVSAWERCAMGVPSLITVIADNQRDGAAALEKAGAALVVGSLDAPDFYRRFRDSLLACVRPARRELLGRSAANITDGLGAKLVIESIIGSKK